MPRAAWVSLGPNPFFLMYMQEFSIVIPNVEADGIQSVGQGVFWSDLELYW